MTGCPMAMEQWSEQFANKKKEDNISAAELSYLPDCTLAEVNDLTNFVLRTCKDSCGRVSRMTNWLGQGDASSIPLDLKHAKLLCTFLVSLVPIIDGCATKLVNLAHDVVANPSVRKARESAMNAVQKLIEDPLQKDKLKGSDFKLHQVNMHLPYSCMCAFTLHKCPNQCWLFDGWCPTVCV